MKRIAQGIGIPIIKLIGLVFFRSKWMRGRHFENGGVAGYAWVWKRIWTQRILGFNRHIPWPCAPNVMISNPRNLEFDLDDLNNFQVVRNLFPEH